MPALTSLADRIAANPSWRASYERASVASESVAKKLPLLHVTRGVLADILNSPEKALAPSSHVRSEGGTLSAEETLGFPASIYLYAGRAFPYTGGAGVGYTPDAELMRTGDATPFDSGGLIAGKIRITLPGSADLQELKKAFVRDSCQSLEEWRHASAQFIGAYFGAAEDYWSGRPAWNDPEQIFEYPENEWRAWTWEIRMREALPILEAAFWCASEEQMTVYLQALEDASVSHAITLNEFLDKALSITGDPEYAYLLEMQAREVCGLEQELEL